MATGKDYLPTDLYPGRHEKGSDFGKNFTTEVLWFGNTERDMRNICEQAVMKAWKNSYAVRMLVAALETSGWNVSCERCAKGVHGGYDPKHNQIILSYRMVANEEAAERVLCHELIHMFDNCRAELDFENVNHVACTEVRAANLIDCPTVSATSSFEPGMQESCVRAVAAESVYKVRGIKKSEAVAAVNSVFGRCYRDLEPFGQRFVVGSKTSENVYRRRAYYGYGHEL